MRAANLRLRVRFKPACRLSRAWQALRRSDVCELGIVRRLHHLCHSSAEYEISGAHLPAAPQGPEPIAPDIRIMRPQWD